MRSLPLRMILLCFSLIFYAVTAVAEEKEKVQKAIYTELKPSFVTNFGGNDGKKLRFIKADISVRASSAEAIDKVMAHNPLIRHQIVMLLSRQTDESISGSTGSGQEAIRLEALKLVQAVLVAETGGPQIDDLLFTSFVVQK